MSIHVAITRRVRPGSEAEFERALHEFFKKSFDHGGVRGASMLVPVPGSNSREFGILRTFADQEERDAFYSSSMFKEWDNRARTLTEGEPQYRELSGLEAWFRSPNGPPPRWKMACATLLGVYPVSLAIGVLLSPRIKNLPLTLNLLVVSTVIVACLTWIVMPFVTCILKPWLIPESQKKGNPHELNNHS